LLAAAAAFFAFCSDFFEGGAGALAASAFCAAFNFFNSFSLAYTFSFIIQTKASLLRKTNALRYVAGTSSTHFCNQSFFL
jgi:hypothetical protein